ncbi:hypothetical protein SASPL_116272 [Salvia splendens]|uniref:Uncharacterized protein n=1 Tax=Salvia splendens TaxID=180675 RepID=A0A8X8XSK7_SALSN|nr:hypothetical protein SASPL_116272 [Salvia splendens]
MWLTPIPLVIPALQEISFGSIFQSHGNLYRDVNRITSTGPIHRVNLKMGVTHSQNRLFRQLLLPWTWVEEAAWIICMLVVATVLAKVLDDVALGAVSLLPVTVTEKVEEGNFATEVWLVGGNRVVFCIYAKEKPLKKKVKQGRFPCNHVECPNFRRNNKLPITEHWKGYHGVKSNCPSDFCDHCGNYKLGGLVGGGNGVAFCIPAKEKLLKKKVKQERFPCNHVECPNFRRKRKVPITEHWKGYHGVKSNRPSDFCNHCGNYKLGGLVGGGNGVAFCIPAKEKLLKKKVKQGRFPCNHVECPNFRRKSKVPITEHWKSYHGVKSNRPSDFCNHCGNYKLGGHPCRFMDPCPWN